MLNSTEEILDSELPNHVFTELDLAYLFKGSPARRYGLVNKALKKGEIIRLRRGLYTIATKYMKEHFSLYYLANHIVPFSYVSCESALQYHGWIPERVNQVSSIAAFGRNKTFTNDFAQFTYHVHPIDLTKFFLGVDSVQINNKLVWIASPLRALIDYIYMNKIKSANVDFLKNNLRIEDLALATIRKSDIKELISIYRSTSIKKFLNSLSLIKHG
jgi:predicted transcriptional regulator of viral defense system